MNCQDFAGIASDLARQQIMEAGTREEALAHSSHCQVCVRKLSDERRLTAELRALVTEMDSVAAPDRIEEQVLAAFRMQSSSPKRFNKRSGWKYLSVAAAAVLLIVFGIAGMRWRLNSSAGDRPEPTSSKTTGVETPPKTQTGVPDGSIGSLPSNHVTEDPHWRKSVVPGRKTIKQSPAQARNGVAASVEPATTAGNNSQSEVATQFMPLGYVSPVSFQEGGQIVRVEFPRSAMTSLGLPVNMDRYGERVKADVLVGADGLARAIRFVQ
ncbi:MAG: hypothetical protein ACREBG_28715 [Pyrinomonadaceae bacterium]